ncbi:MAG: Acetophenone carboxylase subunit Apc3, partial [uncultured Solirubrobacteraceae bacterium]
GDADRDPAAQHHRRRRGRDVHRPRAHPRRRDELPQGPHDALRPVRRLHAGGGGGRRGGGHLARRARHPRGHRPLLDHGGDEPPARALGPARGAHHDGGPRGRDAHRQGRAVDRRHAPGRAARAAAHAQAAPDHPAGAHLGREGARGRHGRRAAPARRGRRAREGPRARGPRGARLRRLAAVELRQPRARAPRQADHPRGVPRLPRGLPAGDPVERGGLPPGRVRALEHRDPRRLPAALDADRALRHVGQAARARLPRPVLHDPQHGRLRRPVQDHGEPHLQRRPDRRPHRRPRHRQGPRGPQRRDRGRRRHVVRHRPRGRRLRAQLRVQPDHRQLDGRHDHAAVPVDRGGRRLHRVDQPRARRPARGRPAERGLLSRPGGLRPGRHGADGDGRQPGAGLPEPGRVLRRAHAARPRRGRAGDPREDRRAARDGGRRGRRADPADHRRQDGLGHPQGGDPARLPPVGVHRLRVRRRRPDAHGGLLRRDPARGDVPVLPGLLRVRLVDHGRRPPLRALPAHAAPAAAHGRADHGLRDVQRDGPRARRRGPPRDRVRGPVLGGRVRLARARHALRRADQLQAGVVPRARDPLRGGRAPGLRALRAGVQRGVQPPGGERAGRRVHRHVRPARLHPRAGPRPARARAARGGRRGGPARVAAGLLARVGRLGGHARLRARGPAAGQPGARPGDHPGGADHGGHPAGPALHHRQARPRDPRGGRAGGL